MSERAIILIGGPKNGEVMYVHVNATRIYVMKPPSTARYSVEQSSTLEDTVAEPYVYEERRFGLKGTHRRMFYFVLAELSDEEACRLVDKYEDES